MFPSLLGLLHMRHKPSKHPAWHLAACGAPCIENSNRVLISARQPGYHQALGSWGRWSSRNSTWKTARSNKSPGTPTSRRLKSSGKDTGVFFLGRGSNGRCHHASSRGCSGCCGGKRVFARRRRHKTTAQRTIMVKSGKMPGASCRAAARLAVHPHY
jgi:hypothetical protein